MSDNKIGVSISHNNNITPKALDFFKELAQLCKKHKVIGYSRGFPVSLLEEYQKNYKITEIWIDKNGEAIVRINNSEEVSS